MLRQVGITLWTIGYAPMFPESTTGFVWEEAGQVIGNITLNPDQGRRDRFMMSNVAVKPDHRRRGIARELVQASIEHLRTMGIKTAVLNVRPNNPGAHELYKALGFSDVETRGDWSLPASHPRSLLPPNELAMSSFRTADRNAAQDLIRSITPENVRIYHNIRDEFNLPWDERIAEAIIDFFIGQASKRWTLKQDDQITALLMVRGQHLASPHRFYAHVQPEARGTLESQLIAFAFNELGRFPQREIRAWATSTHPEWIAALEKTGFQMKDVLTLMALDLQER
jgi:GNAT superfamily N-acetyltransferase